jgi:beta-glucanase (GH16 family)
MLSLLAALAWPLVFQDEFSGTKLNTKCWRAETYRTGNDEQNELQRFVKSNATVKNGMLAITAKPEITTGRGGEKTYTSTQLYSNSAFRYGRFEARIKSPPGKGLWPTFWLLPEQPSYGWHPKSGEIDIMEQVGKEPHTNFANVHFYNWGKDGPDAIEHRKELPANFSDDFHVYGLEWQPGKITWMIDGQPYGVVTNWARVPGEGPDSPFDKPFVIVLNLSVGGIWGGPPTKDTAFPASLLVDWVRVYSPEPVRDPC